MQPDSWSNSDENVGLFTMYKQFDDNYKKIRKYRKSINTNSYKQHVSYKNRVFSLSKYYPPPLQKQENHKKHSIQRLQKNYSHHKKLPFSQRKQQKKVYKKKQNQFVNCRVIKSIQIGSEQNIYKRKKIIRFSESKPKDKRYQTQINEVLYNTSNRSLNVENTIMKTENSQIIIGKKNKNTLINSNVRDDCGKKDGLNENFKRLPPLCLRSRWQRKEIPRFIIRNPTNDYQSYRKVQQTKSKPKDSLKMANFDTRQLLQQQQHHIDLRAYYFPTNNKLQKLK